MVGKRERVLAWALRAIMFGAGFVEMQPKDLLYFYALTGPSLMNGES